MEKILIAGTNGLASEAASWVCNKFEVIGYTTRLNLTIVN